MTSDPKRWAILGRALRDSRTRQGLSAEQLVERAREQGGSVAGRTIYAFERAETTPTRKPQKLEQVAAALGWQPGYVDRILDGEDPNSVLGQPGTPPSAPDEGSPARQAALELLPAVYEFGRAAEAAGGDAALRDELESAAQSLIASIPGRTMPNRSTYGLVAYGPHRPGEPVPDDDAERIERALKDDQ
jgi:transcriptional regulator with XRE-family HTH domain